jgi:hypothetical protein
MRVVWIIVFAAMMSYVAWWLIGSIRKRVVFEVEMALGVGGGCRPPSLCRCPSICRIGALAGCPLTGWVCAPLAGHWAVCRDDPLVAAGRQAGVWLGGDHSGDEERHPRPGAPPHAAEWHLGGLRHGCVATGAGCARPERRVRDLFRPRGADGGPIQRGQVRRAVSRLHGTGASPQPARWYLGSAACAKGTIRKRGTVVPQAGGELNG